MKLRRHLFQLQAWAKDELEAQRRMLAVLQAQEDAIRRGQTAEVKSSGEELERELPGGATRERQRSQVIAELARAFGVPAHVLTLSSIAERAEAAREDVTGLRRLRDELRDCVAAVVRTGRRIAALARYHQEVLGDLLRVLSSTGPEGQVPRDGALVDAEG
jgi:hypothetical protein